MPRSILILHKKRKEKKKGEKVVIDEIARRIETTKRTKKGGEKWSKSLIDKLRSYRSLRRHPFLFFPRREAINLQFFQSFVPPFSSFSKTTAMVRSFDSRQGSKSLASPGNGHLETRPKEWTHREPPRVGQTFRAILVNNSLFLQG